MDFHKKERYGFDDLIEITRILREPGGCPWDGAQTHESIRKNMIEEAYEAVEAIDAKDDDNLCEELGDLLYQVSFHSRMAEERNAFCAADVVDGICKKLVFRHPHIFENEQAPDPDAALSVWEKRKDQEKSRKTPVEALQGIAKSLPALTYAEKVQKKAALCGYPADEPEKAVARAAEAFAKGGKPDIGELLYGVVTLAASYGIDPEGALRDKARAEVARIAENFVK